MKDHSKHDSWSISLKYPHQLLSLDNRMGSSSTSGNPSPWRYIKYKRNGFEEELKIENRRDENACKIWINIFVTPSPEMRIVLKERTNSQGLVKKWLSSAWFIEPVRPRNRQSEPSLSKSKKKKEIWWNLSGRLSLLFPSSNEPREYNLRKGSISLLFQSSQKKWSKIPLYI